MTPYSTGYADFLSRGLSDVFITYIYSFHWVWHESNTLRIEINRLPSVSTGVGGRVGTGVGSAGEVSKTGFPYLMTLYSTGYADFLSRVLSDGFTKYTNSFHWVRYE